MPEIKRFQKVKGRTIKRRILKKYEGVIFPVEKTEIEKEISNSGLNIVKFAVSPLPYVEEIFLLTEKTK